MYRWTDPIEPDGSARHPQPPAADGPAWLTDRPEPRSTYLFGDEPEQATAGWVDTPTEAWRTDAPDGTWRTDPADSGWPAEEQFTVARRPAADGPSGEPGRHRQPRRFPRPLLAGAAAAAATLVATLGVAALALPGDGQQTESTVADDAVAAAPVAPDTGAAVPGDALAPASPTGSPSAAPTSARPSPTRTATPQSSRTTAPSRQLQRTTAPSPAATRATSTNGLSAELQQVVDLVNAERAKAGCKAVTVNDKLTLAAQRHSQDQADHKTMTHDGSDGSDAGERLDRVGYAWRAYGENVAWNQQSPAAVMDAWMNSSGHRANILNCSFTQIGVGVARSNGPYWTQDFGTPR
ncbi:CAP domain-containing protein [Micromonospora eburnea]|uniref:Uncharacterized conserved protein YkwD, contains CAP (CSP/antigen 5/PR1) domain n=1 Tax=Micromonospora eburnea TaxID=227316 RepID=A0A1C6TXW9_9ACTN|nr:CAP domain-containing protein [Micromonospora eburnea]SCL46509.1 Uncharacterized conserved protein YkwD, contains CAP (CSP/antigen 5/PR1) domain [Micromonospora eburnea]